MASARLAWGIDLGNRALKAVKLVQTPQGLKVDDFEVIEHEQILSAVGDNKEAMLEQALANFMQRHAIANTPVAVGVSGQSSFARFIKLPPVEEKQIAAIVRFEAQQQIPFPLDDVEWSYQLFRAGDSPDVEVGIFAMKKDLVGRQISYFTDLNMNVQVVQMVPLAVYNAMYADERIKGTTMFMDSGAENTDLIIADGETVWLRTLSIGGNNFTEALAKAFKLNFAKAEELKRNAATSKYAKQIFQAMRPVFADLVAEVQRSIGFYASVHRDARIKRIVALGSTFRLPGLQKYLQQHLQLDVERIDSFKATPAESKATAFTENVVSLAGAYGLAVQALGQSKITSSLLPESIRRAKMWQEKTRWFGAAAALFVVGTGLAFGRLYYDKFSFGRADQDRKAIVGTINEADQLSRRWASVQKEGQSDRDKILDIKRLGKYRDLWPAVLADIQWAAKVNPRAAGTPRSQWRAIFIDGISCQYQPSMDAIVDRDERGQYRMRDEEFIALLSQAAPAPAAMAGMSDMPMPDDADIERGTMHPGPAGSAGSAVSTGKRGFLVVLKGSTPQDWRYLNSELVAKLQSLDAESAAKAAKPYSVERVKVRKADKRSNFRGQPGHMDAPAWNPEMGMMGGDMPSAPAIDKTRDRLTGESIQNDTEFEVLVAIVLDPPPPARPAGEDASASR